MVECKTVYLPCFHTLASLPITVSFTMCCFQHIGGSHVGSCNSMARSTPTIPGGRHPEKRTLGSVTPDEVLLPLVLRDKTSLLTHRPVRSSRERLPAHSVAQELGEWVRAKPQESRSSLRKDHLGRALDLVVLDGDGLPYPQRALALPCQGSVTAANESSEG